MKKTITEQVERKKLVAMVCDKCKAEEVMYELEGTDISSFKHTFGWLSKHDGTQISFDLCEDCLMLILNDSGVDYRLKRMF